MFGEGTDLGDMPQRFAVGEVVAKCAIGGHSRRQGADTGIAQVLHTCCAPATLAADSDERHHHVVAGLEIGDAVTDFAHDAGTLVAADGGKHGGQPHRPENFVGGCHVALEDVVIGVAQPGGGHLHQNLAGARGV